MAGVIIYPVKGYESGSWQGPASDVKAYSGSSWDSIKNGFFYSAGWKRFLATMQLPITFVQDYTWIGLPSGESWISFSSDGTCRGESITGGFTDDYWDPYGLGIDSGDFAIKATLFVRSGGTLSGTFDTWIPLSSGYSSLLWSFAADDYTNRYATIKFQIRHTPTNTIIVPDTSCTLSIEYTGG